MDTEDYSSDTSDEDFIPQGKEVDVSEEEDSGEDSNVSENEEASNKKKKIKKNNSRKIKKNPLLAAQQNENSEEEDKEINLSESPTDTKSKEKEKELWADFLADVEDKPAPKPKSSKSWSTLLGTKKPSASISNKETSAPISVITKPNSKPTPTTVKVTKVFEFAGEEIKIEEEVLVDSIEAKVDSFNKQDSKPSAKRPLGISGIVGILDNKKKKLSTLEKTKLDWNTFKSDQGIEEQLEDHKKSKDGYLEKQAFLERADVRQFEIEKNMRASKRSNR